MINGLDNLLKIELNEYGFQIDTAWMYFAIDWRFIFSAIGAYVAYKVYKRVKKVW